ncbi:DUF3891 family protein [Bacillaceae bacterium IKA-2]|nr:DUF3891 family protein [Bacillaceae bacterium IKA-2]
MIILKKTNEIVMFTQHHHAFLSGEIAKHFKTDRFQSIDHWGELMLAIYEHDRSWIGLDETPIWNDEKEVPYSFIDYPLIPKLAFYKIGIDEIEQMSPYAALLCSMHYCSFFKRSMDKRVDKFLEAEEKRQTKIINTLNLLDGKLQSQHFRLLQFCDDLSLYLCLNEPGTKKVEEYPWFRDGMANSEIFSEENKPLYAEWLNNKEVAVHSFPFKEEFDLKLQYKRVPKNLIREKGIAPAYHAIEVIEYEVKITR